jgi:tryptophan synthase alpha subunit
LWAVGFGISNPSHIKFIIHSGADAIITGSALIKKKKVIENKKEVSQN